MNWLARLPDFQRSPPGLEWQIWRRLPAILLWGSALPLLLAAVLWFGMSSASLGAEDRSSLLLVYQLIGLVVLHWTLVLTLAIGCAVVMLMKGPAFVADAYPLPEERDTEFEAPAGR